MTNKKLRRKARKNKNPLSNKNSQEINNNDNFNIVFKKPLKQLGDLQEQAKKKVKIK